MKAIQPNDGRSFKRRLSRWIRIPDALQSSQKSRVCPTRPGINNAGNRSLYPITKKAGREAQIRFHQGKARAVQMLSVRRIDL
ncbi:MAG: hypothetical protein ACFFD8_06740 [Candidatus Thorarchaeota archaeon]